MLKIIKPLFAVIIAVLALFIAVNIGDEPLKPEVQQALNWQLPEHALDKDNGWLILLGMDAPEDQDAYENRGQV
jgi:hypothetical protein